METLTAGQIKISVEKLFVSPGKVGRQFFRLVNKFTLPERMLNGDIFHIYLIP